MKKAKRMFAALISAVMTASAAVMTSNANVNIRAGDEVAKLLEGYTKIEDPAGIEINSYEYKTERGAEYYINEYGVVRIISPYPDSLVIGTTRDIEDEEIYKIAANICPDARAVRANDSLMTPDIKTFEIMDKKITLEQAKEIYLQIGDKIRNCRLTSGMYQLGMPQFHKSNHKYFVQNDDAKKMDFTLYKGLENEEKLRNFVEENKLPCSVTVYEGLKAVDVVPDDNVSYIEEIAIAAKIYHALGLKAGFYVIAESINLTHGTNIDLYNSVQGDANCDDETSMADAVLIMQSLANPDKYSITAQGKYNADTEGDGITNADALAVQKSMLELK